jgi:hypothetical protein
MSSSEENYSDDDYEDYDDEFEDDEGSEPGDVPPNNAEGPDRESDDRVEQWGSMAPTADRPPGFIHNDKQFLAASEKNGALNLPVKEGTLEPEESDNVTGNEEKNGEDVNSAAIDTEAAIGNKLGSGLVVQEAKQTLPAENYFRIEGGSTKIVETSLFHDPNDTLNPPSSYGGGEPAVAARPHTPGNANALFDTFDARIEGDGNTQRFNPNASSLESFFPPVQSNSKGSLFLGPSRYEMFSAKGPPLPALVFSTSQLLDQRSEIRDHSTITAASLRKVRVEEQKRYKLVGTSSLLSMRSTVKKKRRWKKRLPSLIAQRHSTFVVKRNVLQRFALQNLDEDADDGWGGKSPELYIEEFYKRVHACMLVNHLRNKDMFKVADVDGDGVISVNDFVASMKYLNLKIRKNDARRYILRAAKLFLKRKKKYSFKFKGGLEAVMDEDVFSLELNSRNHDQQSRRSSRMRTYTRRHARMMSKIRKKRETATMYNPDIKKVDVTFCLKDPQACDFWRSSFGEGCGKVSENKFMKSFRSYVNEMKKKQAKSDLQSGRSSPINASSSMASSQSLSPSSRTVQDWVFGRAKGLLTNKYGLVTVKSFNDFINMFGPFEVVLDNIIAGTGLSKEQTRLRKYKEISQRIRFSTKTKTIIKEVFI